jgi:hypothetical protein
MTALGVAQLVERLVRDESAANYLKLSHALALLLT